MERKNYQRLGMYQAVNELITITPALATLRQTQAFTAQATVIRDGLAALQVANQNETSGISTGQRAQDERDAAYTIVRTQLKRIAAVARVLDKTIPGIRKLAIVPRAHTREAQRLTVAQTIMADMTPYAGQLTAAGLPSDFLIRLGQAINAATMTVRDRYTARRHRTEARANAIKAIRGMRSAVDCLGVIIHAWCDTDAVNGPAVREAWESARRVKGGSRGETHDAATAVATGTPVQNHGGTTAQAA